MGPEKRFKMETITPISYRRQPEILPDSSPLGQVTTPVDMSITKTSSEGGSFEEGVGGSSSNGSLVGRSMNKLQVTTPMKEEDVMILAKTTITANEFHDSSEAFRKRTSSLPNLTTGRRYYIFPPRVEVVMNRSQSRNDIDLSSW